jgi:hypothetical protein
MAEISDAPKTAPVSADAPAPETTAKAATTTTTPATPATKPAARGRKAPVRKTTTSRETKAKVARATTAAAKSRTARPATAGTKAPRKAADASLETKAKAARATAAGTRRPAISVVPEPEAQETTFTGLTAVPRSFGLAAAEYVEENAERYAAFQETLADNTPVEWVAKVVRANAKATREIGHVTARSARTLLEV